MNTLEGNWRIKEQGEMISQVLQITNPMYPVGTDNAHNLQEYAIERDAFYNHHYDKAKRGIYKWDDYINTVDLNEYILDSIRNGPASNFFEKLEQFNDDYCYLFNRIEESMGFKLDVYDKSLRWKRGSYNHLKAWMKEYLLNENKRPAGINSIFERVHNNMYMFERFQGRISLLEQLRKQALDSGFGRDIDEDAVLESFESFKSIPNQELMNDFVDFDYYIQDNGYMRDTKVIVLITMKKDHFNMIVNHGDNNIAEIPYDGDVQILYQFPFFKRFTDYYADRPLGSSVTKNKMKTVGRYAVDTPFKFPWIAGDSLKRSHPDRYGEDIFTVEDAIERIYGGWGNCCWGSFETTILKSLYSLDHNAIIMGLTQWGTFYDNENSNPHNNIKTFHLGIESEDAYFSEDYINLTGYVEQCAATLLAKYYDNDAQLARLTREYANTEYGGITEQSDYKDCIIEQLLAMKPNYFVDSLKSSRIFGDKLIDAADFAIRQLSIKELEMKLEAAFDIMEWYDNEDGGELEDQDGEASIPASMEQWAGTRAVVRRTTEISSELSREQYDNVLESTDETTRLERQRIAARQQLNNI